MTKTLYLEVLKNAKQDRIANRMNMFAICNELTFLRPLIVFLKLNKHSFLDLNFTELLFAIANCRTVRKICLTVDTSTTM